MKKIYALVLLLLCATMLLTLVACKTTPPTPDEQPPVDEPAATVDIILDGATSYRIIRSDLYSAKDPITQAAVTLRKAIEAATGCDIDITTDYDDATDLEILVGDTNREANALIPTDLEFNEYVIIYQDGKLVIAGGDADCTQRAVEYFISTYLTAAEGTTINLTLPENLNYRGAFEYPTIVYQIYDIKSMPGVSGTPGHNDIVRFIASLQGRLNKYAEENGFYLYWMYDSTDEFWLKYISSEGKMFEGAVYREIRNWDDLWSNFGTYIQELGMVAWDPDVPSTANVAGTICAVEGYLPVRFSTEKGSMYQWLRDHDVPLKENLYAMFDGTLGSTIADTDIPSTGSAKCDAYLWALEKYGDRCNSEMVAYTLDGASTVEGNPIYETAQGRDPNWNQLYSHDYLILNECFFFDLTCYEKEAPCDDPDQPIGTDTQTLHTILSFFCEKNNGKMGKLMGFPPWYMKYTNFRDHGTLAPPRWSGISLSSFPPTALSRRPTRRIPPG